MKHRDIILGLLAPADEDAPEAVQPAVCPLHHPTPRLLPRPPLGRSRLPRLLGDMRREPELLHDRLGLGVIVAVIHAQALRLFVGRRGPLDGDALDGLADHLHVGPVGQGLRSTDRPYSSLPVDLVKGRDIRFSRNLSAHGGERWPLFPSSRNSNPTCRSPSSLPSSRTPGEPTAACTACKTSSSSPCVRSSPEPRTGSRS